MQLGVWLQWFTGCSRTIQTHGLPCLLGKMQRPELFWYRCRKFGCLSVYSSCFAVHIRWQSRVWWEVLGADRILPEVFSSLWSHWPLIDIKRQGTCFVDRPFVVGFFWALCLSEYSLWIFISNMFTWWNFSKFKIMSCFVLWFTAVS